VRTVIGAVVVAAGLMLAAPAALAHQGNPHYRSQVLKVTPAVNGVSVSVLNYDDRLLLQNTSGQPVVVEDYEGRPYARVLPDRTVEVNTNSQAYYLNDDRYANVTVPKGLASTPHWKLVSRTGRFEWHDHRIHWMSTTDPPQLKDKSKATHIFDWKVPIAVGTAKGAIAGKLTWVPLSNGGSLPMGAIWTLAGLLIALSLILFVVRRRRAQESSSTGAAEVW
jgi:hypothetical protein